MFQVRRGTNGINRFIRELVFAQPANSLREGVAGKLALRAFEFRSQEFQPIRFRPAETLHRQRQPLLGTIGDRQYPPC